MTITVTPAKACNPLTGLRCTSLAPWAATTDRTSGGSR